VVSANLAVSLARSGKRVIILDADFSGSNLHTVFGLHHPKHTLGKYLSGKISAPDLLTATEVENLQLICGDQAGHDYSNMEFREITRIFNLKKLLPADYFIFDIGAGSHKMATDIFSAADLKITVMTAEPTSLENCYGLIKNALARLLFLNLPAQSGSRLYFRQLLDPHQSGGLTFREILARHAVRFPEYAAVLQPRLNRFFTCAVLNRVNRDSQLKVLENFQALVSRFLNIQTINAGYVVEDPKVSESVVLCRPFTLQFPESKASECVHLIARNLVKIHEKMLY
jgi:flagellar biosynthesis protein FlhG